MPLYGKWVCILPYMGPSFPPWVFGLTKMSPSLLLICIYIYNIRTLSVNIKFICTSFRNRQNSEPSASFSGLFRSEYK